MSQIDKQKTIKWLERFQQVGIISLITQEIRSGRFDSDIDYQQRYEALVQALIDAFADDVHHPDKEAVRYWITSTCSFMEDVLDDYAGPSESTKRLMLEESQ